ncbi:MAG TPA: bifunctional adenosylcobinamide kinase/adenosylcobinamide-phosphate guanylyltransferase [Methylocella sp.]|nr:bifunctional adenosylcobinamide kinase/adenosylcobinamide-phosphate guanylyltransferase [Methylocella sp.]
MTDQPLIIRSLLILGGARSGKSHYAQKLAEAAGLTSVLIATAEASDDEMAARIARHAADRDSRWQLIEQPIALAPTLRREARLDRILVVDCVTLWLANLFQTEAEIEPVTAELVETISVLKGPVIFVSNEVGGGIVPDNALARAFREAQGFLNQALAQACDSVVLVTAAIPLRLKPATYPNFKFWSEG